MTESELTRAVIAVARQLDYLTAHFLTSQDGRGNYRTAVSGDGKGFPDLVLAGRGRIMFVELKAGTRLRPDQVVWRDEILANGGEWHLWTETDWLAGTVEAVLRGEGK